MSHRDDLEPGTPPELLALAERLSAARPVPRAAFRGALRRRLLAHGVQPGRPERLCTMIAASAAGGAGLLLAGALSAAGIGPLGA